MRRRTVVALVALVAWCVVTLATARPLPAPAPRLSVDSLLAEARALNAWAARATPMLVSRAVYVGYLNSRED